MSEILIQIHAKYFSLLLVNAGKNIVLYEEVQKRKYP